MLPKQAGQRFICAMMRLEMLSGQDLEDRVYFPTELLLSRALVVESPRSEPFGFVVTRLELAWYTRLGSLVIVSLLAICTVPLSGCRNNENPEERPAWHPETRMGMPQEQARALFSEPPLRQMTLVGNDPIFGELRYEVEAYELEMPWPWEQGQIVLTFRNGRLVRTSAHPRFIFEEISSEEEASEGEETLSEETPSEEIPFDEAPFEEAVRAARERLIASGMEVRAESSE